MKTIHDIYEEYTIMPNLQEHQLRVASVAQIICDHLSEPLDTKNIVSACLLHDMGNIIKSDLNYFPEFMKEKGIDYWQKVKADYIEKYGTHEHVATLAIAKELGVNETVMTYLEQVGFSKLDKTAADNSFSKKICSYADMRVGPHGIISVAERLADGKKRYEGRPHTMNDKERYDTLVQSLYEIEKQIFKKTNIKPEDINDAAVKNVIEELKSFTL